MSVAARFDRCPGVPGARALRWLLAAGFTVLAHAAAVWIILNWRSAEVAPSEPPPAVTIDLSPLAISKAPEEDVAVGPQTTETAPPPSDEAAERTKSAAAPDPSPLSSDKPAGEAAPKPPASTSPEIERKRDSLEIRPAATDMEATDRKPAPSPPSKTNFASDVAPAPSATTDEELSLPQAPDPQAGAAPPPPSSAARAPPEPAQPPGAIKAREAPAIPVFPKVEPPVVPAKAAEADEAKPSAAPPPKASPRRQDAKRTKAESKQIERMKAAKPEDRREVDSTRAPAASNAQAVSAAASPASSSGATLSSVLATWKGELIAHINRFKRFPPNAASGGTASVGFAINRAGAVVSVRLISSSGDRALDEEAVALLHRASPAPPPPAQLGKGVVTLTVPIRFDR